MNNRKSPLCEISETVNTPTEQVLHILKDMDVLRLKKLCGRWVTHLIQKKTSSESLLETFKYFSFLK